MRTLEDHTGGVTAVAVSPDSEHIVPAGVDRIVRVWQPCGEFLCVGCPRP